eukprot:11196178-Lingulodinium_polyedra.AAC.1
MTWAVPEDVLEAAQHDWACSEGPAVLRRRLQGRPVAWQPGQERTTEGGMITRPLAAGLVNELP